MRKQLEISTGGAGRLVLISGGIASGKTALLNELLDEAAPGALTLSATGACDEQGVGAAVIEQLLANSTLDADVRDRLASMLERPPAQAVGDLCNALLELTREQPVIIGVDDLHFADETSRKLLLQLQRRIRSTRLLVVLSQPDWSQTSHLVSNRFARQPRYFPVHLAPMSVQGVSALLDETLEDGAGSELPSRIHALSAGNPLLTSALIDDYRDGDRSGHPVVGAAYTRAVYAFLDHPEAKLLDVTAAVAVLGGRDTDLVANLADLDREAVAGMLDALGRSGLLGDEGFRHPDTEALVLTVLSPAERARLHASAAGLKYRHAAPANEVAGHLVAAGGVPPGWAVPVLRLAAEQGLASNDARFAAQCLELALTAPADENEERAIRQSFVRSTWRVNPSAVAGHVASLRQGALDGTLDEADCLALLRHSLWQGDRKTFVRAREVLGTGREPLDPQTEAELNLAHQWHFGPPTAGTDVDDTDGQAGTAPWNHTADTLMRAWPCGGSETAVASAQRILQNCRLGDTTLEALATAITTLAHGGGGERAEQWCARLSRQANELGAVTWQAMIEALWADIVLHRGDVPGAAQRARASLDMLGEQNWGVSISYPLTTLLLANIAEGAFEDAATTLRRPVPPAMFDTVGGLRYVRACGQFYLATNRPLAAVSDFQKCRRLMARWEATAPTLTPWRSDLAEANLQLGNVAVARKLAKQQAELSAGCDPYAYGLSLRVLAFTSSPGESAELLGRASKCFQEAGQLLELNKTRRSVAQRHIPRQRKELAGEIRLVEREAPPARALGDSSGGGGERAGGEAHRGQPEPGDSTVLSAAELRVAQLAALGHTNQQIGASLFITVSTVEQHLTRTYRKLGIPGRSALACELRLRHPQLISMNGG